MASDVLDRLAGADDLDDMLMLVILGRFLPPALLKKG